MKKIWKTLTALCTAALAVIGGFVIYQKFFKKDGEFDEDFDDEELFEEDEEDDVTAFDNEEEIFEEEDTAPSGKADVSSETEDADHETPEK